MAAQTNETVRKWFYALQQGDRDAASNLWHQFYHELEAFAKPRMTGRHRRGADEEDVALSVLNALITGARAGRFDSVQSRDELWYLLVSMAKQNIIDRRRKGDRIKRGAGKVRGNSALGISVNGQELTFDHLCNDERPHELISEIVDEHRHLMTLLPNDMLRQIALATLEGSSIREIANDLSVSTRTVQRKLGIIRAIWAKALADTTE